MVTTNSASRAASSALAAGLAAGGGEGGHRLGGKVEAVHLMARLQQVAGHRPAHVAETR
jgi:hypothetical protein